MPRPGCRDLDEVTAYCEPIYRFCVKRLGPTQAAEDLAQEILTEALEGLRARPVDNLEAWIWTIARNRFRRLFMARPAFSDAAILDIHDGPDTLQHEGEQRLVLAEEKAQVFRAVVGLAEKYRRVVVAYYVYGESYEQIAARLSLPMSSVKWRMHEGRRRLRERWDSLMDEPKRVYDRADWWIACNGSMDPNRYLRRQIARAIALAAYDQPATVEEVSQATGIPAAYIEDELDELLYGDALEQMGPRYATNFIILRLADHRRMIERFTPLAADLAAGVMAGIRDRESSMRRIGFRGSDLPLGELLWVLVPRVVRAAGGKARGQIPDLQRGEPPKRKDGGFGWFVVQEGSMDDHGNVGGLNQYTLADGRITFDYYWIARYFSEQFNGVLHTLETGAGAGFLASDGTVAAAQNEPLAARMIECGLAQRVNGGVSLRLPLLTEQQDQALAAVLDEVAQTLAPRLSELVRGLLDAYRSFTPARLHGQITGVIGGYLNNTVGMVVGVLEEQGVMRRPTSDEDQARSCMVTVVPA